MTAQRMVIPPTAFSVGRASTKKRPREKNSNHLAFIRRLQCAACGTHANIEAAHVRVASPVHGKRETGISEKPSDKWSVPLCANHHTRLPDSQHEIGEEKFWSALGMNPCDLALALFACTGDEDLAETIINLQRERGAR